MPDSAKPSSLDACHLDASSQSPTFTKLVYSAKHVIGASAASFCSVLVGFPFDTIKTRMQWAASTVPMHKYNSMHDCIRKTYSKEGLQGFLRGLGPPLASVALVKSLSFSIYTSTKAQLSYLTNWNTDQSYLSLVSLATVAGSTAGVGVTIISCPLELIKIQRQLEKIVSRDTAKVPVPITTAAEPVKTTRTSWRVARDIIRGNGVAGLYRGIGLHCLRDSIGTGVYFSSYEGAKRLLSSSDGKSGPLTHLLSGGISGVSSWLVIFPLDLIKTKKQAEVLAGSGTKVTDMVRSIFQRDGIRGFYSGFTATLFRAIPIHSINWIVYEQVVKTIEQTRPAATSSHRA
ncbi:hypothetical protein SeLEV6574_g03527 [Synchytrium endobioticum]|nr:hypothetical protein SeLEV6574_g03527 [Synchytrium endobioticum]